MVTKSSSILVLLKFVVGISVFSFLLVSPFIFESQKAYGKDAGEQGYDDGRKDRIDGKSYNDYCSPDLNDDLGCASYKAHYFLGWNAAKALYGGQDNSNTRYYDDPEERYHDDDDDDDDDDDYNRYNHNGYQTEIELTVRIVGEKYNMPDFKIKAGQDSTIAYGNEFEDDGKAKVRLNIYDSTQKVCISTVNTDVHFKKCKQITSDEITFTLR